MIEEWRILANSNNLIEVSNLGNVRKKFGNEYKLLRQVIIGDRPGLRYLRVDVVPIGRKRVHRLVVQAFIGEIPEESEIDHIDGNTLNNRVDNLRIVSRRENHQNRRPCSNTGHKNVHLRSKDGKYQVIVDRKYIGAYTTLDEAVQIATSRRMQLGYLK